MAWEWPKKRGNPVERHWGDGPTWAGGAGISVSVYADGTIHCKEYDWFGRVIVEYDGEPRDAPEDAPPVVPPPRYHPEKGEKPYPLPPVPRPPPWPTPIAAKKG